MSRFRYATSQVAVHWLAAVVIIFMLVTGTFVLDDMPNDAGKIGSLRVHMILGALAGLLVVTRIFMRKRLPAPPAEPGDRWGRIGQVVLNLLVLLLVFSGAMLAWQSGAFDAVFGAGTLPHDFKQYLPRKIHGLVSKLVMAVVALHVLAALFHQLVVKDKLLSRMSFRRG